jgi:HK97 family phage portal protein
MLMLHLLMCGNAYVFVSRSMGRVVELIPLDPRRMDVRPETELTWSYHYSPLNGGQVRYAWSEIMHIRGLSWKNWIAMSPVMDVGREAIGLGMQQRQHAAKLFANGAQTSGFIKVSPERQLSPEAIGRLEKSFADKYAGVDNAWKLVLLEDGLEFQPATMTSEESQLIESRKFEIAEIARLFGVPPHMIGEVDKSTSWGSGIEQQSIGFLIYTLMPWLTNIAQRVRVNLLLEPEWSRYEARFDTEPLTRGDFKSLQEGLQIMRQNGIINGDEWRIRVGMNPTGDDTGRDFWRPSNMLNASRPEANPQPQPQQQRPNDAPAAHLAALPSPPRLALTRQP